MSEDTNRYHRVKAHPTARISPAAGIVGDVTIGRDASIFAGVQIRADFAPVIVGDEANIQEGAILHVDRARAVRIGAHATIGHGAIAHGCDIGENALVGMGAIVMNGAVVGRDAVVAAGAVVTEGREVPPRSLAMGTPAKVVRELSDEEVAELCTQGADDYLRISAAMVAEGALAHPAPDMNMQVGA